MGLSTPVKAAALVIFIAAIASATYGVQTMLGDTVGSQAIGLSAQRAAVNATPGHDVTFLVTVANRDTIARDVSLRVEGIATGESTVATVRGNANSTFFVTVTIPETAPPGEHDLVVIAESDGEALRERAGLLHITILPPAPGFAPRDEAEMIYAGRLSATGSLFNTNDRSLVGLPLRKTETYRFSDGIMRVVTTPRPSVVPGLYEGMLGMQPGESRTIHVPFAKAYGPATDELVYPRIDVINRDLTLVNDLQRVPRETFDTYVVETRQGAPADFEVGSIFLLDQSNNHWPYRIVAMTNTSVDYRLAAKAGDVFTVYPFWENASAVVAINDSAVVFHTTPTTDPGRNFTYRASWPDMTTLVEYNDTEVKLRHSPPVGYSYTHVTEAGQPREATVREVGADRILVALPSQNPLAGKDLTFDVTVLSVTKRQ